MLSQELDRSTSRQDETAPSVRSTVEPKPPSIRPLSLVEYLNTPPVTQIVHADHKEHISWTKNKRFADETPDTIFVLSDWLEVLTRDLLLEDLLDITVNLDRHEPLDILPLTLRVANESDIVYPLLSDIVTRVSRALEVCPKSSFAKIGFLRSPITLGLTPSQFCLPRISHESESGFSNDWRTVLSPDLLAYVYTGEGGEEERWDSERHMLYNRLPGEIKPSWKVKSPLDPETKGAHMMALLQEHYYMVQRNSRYGFILTDKELFCLKKDETGRSRQLFVTPGISLNSADAKTIRKEGLEGVKFSAPVALFCLCILASQDSVEIKLPHWKHVYSNT